MDLLYLVLLRTHVILSFIALASGTASIIAPKGKSLHINCGKLFYYSMLFGLPLALIICILPGHENPFLFSIGVFSIYFVIRGKRTLQYSRKEFSLFFDKIFSALVLLTSVLMLILPPIMLAKLNPVLAAFGLAGIFFTVQDLYRFRNPERLPQLALADHIAKMTGAFVAALTAFLVNISLFPGMINWFLPGILASIIIPYYQRKFTKKPKKIMSTAV